MIAEFTAMIASGMWLRVPASGPFRPLTVAAAKHCSVSAIHSNPTFLFRLQMRRAVCGCAWCFPTAWALEEKLGPALVALPENRGIVFEIRIALRRLDALAGTAAGAICGAAGDHACRTCCLQAVGRRAGGSRRIAVMQLASGDAVSQAVSLMKTPVSKLILAASLFAVACAFTLPTVQAADDAEKAAKKKKKEEADLKKYDKNGNGKLDPDEKAALEADVKKAKEEKKKKEGK